MFYALSVDIVLLPLFLKVQHNRPVKLACVNSWSSKPALALCALPHLNLVIYCIERIEKTPNNQTTQCIGCELHQLKHPVIFNAECLPVNTSVHIPLQI